MDENKEPILVRQTETELENQSVPELLGTATDIIKNYSKMFDKILGETPEEIRETKDALEGLTPAEIRESLNLYRKEQFIIKDMNLGGMSEEDLQALEATRLYGKDKTFIEIGEELQISGSHAQRLTRRGLNLALNELDKRVLTEFPEGRKMEVVKLSSNERIDQIDKEIDRCMRKLHIMIVIRNYFETRTKSREEGSKT